MATNRYPIRVDRRFRLILRLFGVRDGNAWVDLPDEPGGELDARFGRFRVHTPIANVAHWRLEGPWSALTAIGVRMSIRHRDLTFAGTNRGGVRIDFRERVPYGPFGLPALYVTVEDLEGLGAALSARGITGEDGRTRIVP